MFSVRINGIEKCDEIDENWINKQINGLRKDNLSVCVQVRIKTDSIDMLLSSGGCTSGQSGDRPPNGEEQKIFDLWHKHQLKRTDFPMGHLISFLHN